MSEYESLFKLLLIGDAGTGKSCILMRYCEDSFTESYISTIGVDFRVRSLNSNSGRAVKLQIWDTAGQERFRTITSSYYRGAHAILVVFDVSDRSSFDNLSNWLAEIRRLASENVHIVIVANKCDLETRQVSREEIANFCSSHGDMSFFEVSAKNNTGIHDAFQFVTEALVNNVPYTDYAIKPIEDIPNLNNYQQPPPPQSVEDYINLATMVLSTKVLPSEQNEIKPQLSEFQKKVAHKPTSWKLGLTVGEFEQPKSSLTVRYKTDSDASAIAYELGLESNSVAIAVSFKATDDAESFRLGELSSTVKGLLEPLLNTGKTTFTTNVVNEFDGTKIFRMVWEIKDQGLYDVLRQIMTVSETSKFEIDLEFSERPCKNSPSEFCFARLKLDTEFKRVFHSFGGKDIASLLFSSGDAWIFLSFFSAMKKFAFELEFDSWAEFWSEIICKSGGDVPPFLEKFGWHSAEAGIQQFLFGNMLATDTREIFYAIYKDLDCLAGLHGIQLVFGNQHVLDIKGDNLDLLTMLPSLTALQEAQNSFRTM